MAHVAVSGPMKNNELGPIYKGRTFQLSLPFTTKIISPGFVCLSIPFKFMYAEKVELLNRLYLMLLPSLFFHYNVLTYYAYRFHNSELSFYIWHKIKSAQFLFVT
jgi:hypothetical protein